MTRPSRSFGPRSKRRSPGSMAPAIPIATASSSIIGRPGKVSRTRDGRIPTTRSFTPTAGSPKARSHLRKCRATSTVPSGWRPAVRNAWGGRNSQAGSGRRRSSCRALRRELLVSPARDLRARARRQQGALPRTQLQCRAGPFHRHRQARKGDPGRPRPDGAAVLLGMGHSHHCQHRGPLQPDVLPQRLDLAAR